MTDALKQFIPTSFFRLKHKLLVQSKYKNRSNASIFSEIYEDNLWGGEANEFNSGEGTEDENAQLYLVELQRFIESNGVESVIEIGCGDFRLMHSILINMPTVKYTGIDVVPNLIGHLNQKYASPQVSFLCADAVLDTLPVADVCIIRQVLQHLSNDQIGQILQKMTAYKYVIITEHIPLSKNAVPNKDKPAGPDIRLYDYSGVFIDQAPFNQKGEIMVEYRADCKVFNKTIPAAHRTYLIRN